MTYPVNTGSSILAVDYNLVQTTIGNIAGYNSLGYGVNDLRSEAVTTGTQITALQWNDAIEDLNRISRHQTGTSIIQQAGIIASPGGVTWVIDTTNTTNYISSTTNIYSTNRLLVSPSNVTWSVSASGGASTIVSASGYYVGSQVGGGESTGTVFPTFNFTGRVLADNSNKIWDIAQGLIDNRFSVAEDQLTPLVNTDSISTRVSTWDGAINHIVKANWATAAQANYFFNLGGYVELDASQTGTPSTTADSAWVSLINSLSPVYYTRHDWVNWTSTSTEVTGAPPNNFVKYRVLAEKTDDNEVTFNISFVNTTTALLAYPNDPVWVLGSGSGAQIYTYPTSRTWTVGTGFSIEVSPSSATWNVVT